MKFQEEMITSSGGDVYSCAILVFVFAVPKLELL